MRRAGVLLLSALLSCGAAVAGEAHWLPSHSDVEKLEAQAKPPKGYRLDQYDRSYSGTFVSDRKVIEGHWIQVRTPGQKPRVTIVTYDQLPQVMDGGCSVVTVYYDLATAKVTGVACNGVA